LDWHDHWDRPEEYGFEQIPEDTTSLARTLRRHIFTARRVYELEMTEPGPVTTVDLRAASRWRC
jgi:hypothetical protein